MPAGQKVLKLQDVWRTCDKIRAAIFRVGLNLWTYYKPLDPKDESLISESKFVSALAGPLKGAIGLNEREICDLADYFRVQDGRILYKQFCRIIHDSVPEFSDKNKTTAVGLEEREDLQLRANALSLSEERKLSVIVARIALLLSKRKLPSRPYFQDYELISQNAGTVGIAHFGRILKFLGIVLRADEFRLLVKRFVKDGYTVNYVAFLRAVDEAHNYLDRCGASRLDGQLLDDHPGMVVITANLPKLARPEIGKVLPSAVFGEQSIFHPVANPPAEFMGLEEVIRRVQRHIFERRIRIHEFFKDFDRLNAGKVSTWQFRRGLDSLQVSSLGRLHLAEEEIQALIALYKDPNEPDSVRWRSFQDDVDRVFTVKGLEKTPNLRVESPPKEVAELRRRGQSDWHCQSKGLRELCEEVLEKVRRRVDETGIILERFFKNYDRANNGHVTRGELRKVLKTAPILLSPQEEFALEKRYNDDLGFNYALFTEEVEMPVAEEPLYRQVLKEKEMINRERTPEELEASVDESNIVLILAKVKGKIVRERIKVLQFFRPFDPRNELTISRENFKRGLDQLRCNLTRAQVETIMKVFRAPLRPDFVDYLRFAGAVEEAVSTGSLERAPLLVPVQHVPAEVCSRAFLNFRERRIVERALEKLSKINRPNLRQILTDFDKERIGTVSKDRLIKALSMRNMLRLIGNEELDVLHKCFAVERGGRLEIDYRAFLLALRLLRENKRTLPF